jgi:autotransporter translocation and assembly factor TamB
MENLRYLLAAIAALTLIMSIVSSVNQSYAGLNAYADHDDKVDNEHEDEQEQQIRKNSKVKLQVKEGEGKVELEIQMDNGDIEPGTYNVTFSCTKPEINLMFADALAVKEDGEADFETEISLKEGVYEGCHVTFETVNVSFESFSITGDHDEEHEKFKSKLKTDDDGVEIEVEVQGLNMTDGSYDAVFACEQPSFNMTLDGAFEVEDGKGELEAEIGLTNGTYTGCNITVEGTEITSFDTFTVSEETEEEHEREVEEKREEKKKRIVTTTNGTRIHEKHRSEKAASPGEYQLGWNYTLMANGTAVQRGQTETSGNATATVNVNMTVWKSTGAIILLDVIDGTVEIGNQTYTVVLGYALYTIHYDTFRIGALAVDDDGNVYKLRLTGTATDSDAEFPMESNSIELNFGGSRGPPDRFEDWDLTLKGTVEAG